MDSKVPCAPKATLDDNEKVVYVEADEARGEGNNGPDRVADARGRGNSPDAAGGWPEGGCVQLGGTTPDCERKLSSGSVESASTEPLGLEETQRKVRSLVVEALSRADIDDENVTLAIMRSFPPVSELDLGNGDHASDLHRRITEMVASASAAVARGHMDLTDLASWNKSHYGNAVYRKLVDAHSDLAPKLTGMFMELHSFEVEQMLADDTVLSLIHI